jgi:hypothetical protein
VTAQSLRQSLRFPVPLPGGLGAQPQESDDFVAALLKLAREGGDVYGHVHAHTREQLRAAGKTESFLGAWEAGISRKQTSKAVEEHAAGRATCKSPSVGSSKPGLG